MGERSLVLLLVAAGALGAGHARAQDRAEALTLDDVIALARDAPASRLADARASVDAAAVTGADHWANPTFSYEGWFTVDGFPDAWNGYQSTFALGLPLAFADPMGARRHAAELEADASVARAEAVRAAASRDAVEAFFRALVADARLVALEGSLTELRRLLAIVEARASAGDRSRYDVARVELEVARIEAERRAAETAADAARRELGAMLGASDWAPRPLGELGATLVPASDLSFAAVAPRLAIHTAAERAVEARRADLVRERREAFPVPTLALGYGVATDRYASALLVGLEMPLPIFDRNERAIAVAEAEVGASEEELATVDRLAEARLARLRAVVARAAADLSDYDRDVVARGAPLYQMTEAAYRSGAGSVLELVDAVRTVREVELTRIDRIGELRAAEVGLLDAAGLLATPRRSPPF